MVKKIRDNKFLFSFDVKEDFERVKDGKPWSFERCLVVLKDFDGEIMDPEEIKFGMEEFWVHVIELPLKLMTKEIVVTTGKNLKVDGEGENLKDSFTRIKVQDNFDGNKVSSRLEDLHGLSNKDGPPSRNQEVSSPCNIKRSDYV
ncbi:Uncharacterized protein TCM_039465 [Theobroma cacao]|uniref:Uncharacterized protein n=1 Tax=Theobroma cacao TaxID=3641 RepID=A0A061GQB5_THECC|nr:Uncharacterized protein TCM_039465 [Theobroma cacao]